MLESGRERERERKGSWRRRKRREEQAKANCLLCTVGWEEKENSVGEREGKKRPHLLYCSVLMPLRNKSTLFWNGENPDPFTLLHTLSDSVCICPSPAHANRSCSYATVMLSYYGLLNILVPITSDTSLNCNLWRAGRNFQKSDDKLTWLESSVLFLPQLKWS